MLATLPHPLGFLGYLLVPAQGAWLAAPHDFTTALNGGPLTRLNDAIVRAGTNNGVWFKNRSMWVQNEDTDKLPDVVVSNKKGTHLIEQVRAKK